MIKIFGLVIMTQDRFDEETEKAYDRGMRIGEEAGYDSHPANYE